MMCLGILLTMLMMTAGGCKVEEKDDAKVSDMKFTVISEKELPDELKKIIEEKKQKEMKLTYMSGDKLYIVRGYGVQKTGGYSIRIEDVSLWENAIHVQTMLIGPKEENLKDEPSYPYLVIRMEYRDEPVIFE